LHTLLLPILLLIGVSLCKVLDLVVSFPASPSSLQTDFVCIFYCVFGFGGFIGSFLREVFTSPYLVFYLLINLRIYGVHWIDLSLSFSKIPSLLRLESGCKCYHCFRLQSFLVGANPVCTRIFTGRPVSTRRHRDFYWEAGFNQAAPGYTPVALA
jgi:hypothetical protein